MKKPRITVLGSLNMDLVTVTEKMPQQGETITGQAFSTFPGGKGANQAVAAARLGAEVYMFGKVGNDLFGKKLKEILNQENVNVDYVDVETNEETGTASIIISDDDNRIIVVPGANKEVTPEWVSSYEEQIRKSDTLLLQLEIPLESVIKAAQIAKKHKIPVILNPAPYQKLPNDLLMDITYLTPNEHEYKKLLEEATKEEFDIIRAKSIITKGVEGVEFHLINEKILVNALKVDVVDTTGAGDTFNGALAVELSKNQDIKDAVLFAAIAGSLSVTKLGAQSGMPSLNDVKKIYELQK
ncbi:ribokinase [Neobacillus niacini]|uniref:ribokinase n=1 Tax=Neobacillus niacini TaxID=86668 RepID=UPI0027D7C80B|nr:ribokinase [Neobacillus niacini]